MTLPIEKINYSNRHTIGISILENGNLVVKAPRGLSAQYIRNLVKQKAEWIAKKREIAFMQRALYPRKSYEQGEKFEMLSKELTLTYSDSIKQTKADGLSLLVPCSMYSKAPDAIESFYRREALQYITARLQYYSKLCKIPFKCVKISGALKRYGSCSGTGSLNFSYRLILAAPIAIDYVVVHELSHIVHHNHSRAFWGLVAAIMPDYMQGKQWLISHTGMMREDLFTPQ